MAFKKVCSLDEVPEGDALRVELFDEPIALFNLDGEILATQDRCTTIDAEFRDHRCGSGGGDSVSVAQRPGV